MAISGFEALAVSDYIPRIKSALNHYKSVIAHVVAQPLPHTWNNSIQPLEEAAESLDRLWNLLDHVNAVNNTAAIRDIYDELLPVITNFHTDILQDEQLYKVYLAVQENSEFKNLSSAQQMIILNELRDFKLSGVSLALEQRAVYKSLVEQVTSLENKFANNVLDATEGWNLHIAPEAENILAGLPLQTIENAKAKAALESKPGWILTLDQSCYHSVMSYAVDRNLRQQFYTAYNTRCSDQGPSAGKWDNTLLIAEILQIRKKMASMVGYANYAEYSLAPKMANTVEQVNNFLHAILGKTKPKAQQEYAALCEFAAQHHNIDKLEVWDVPYYSELYKQEYYNFSEEELRSYFPEPRVLTGLFKLVRNIFGLEIEEVTAFESWHPSVRMFKVVDKNNELRGYFYTDLYTREGKRGGAWMSECQFRMRFASDLLQYPVAYLNCNFSPPIAGQPGLLTHSDVITLFHEFGHSIHHVLTKVDYYSVSGIHGVAWDAIELPSQFMENWCWEWEVIQDISENINTGEPLPRIKYEQLLATKNFQSALSLLRQLEFALFDFRVHANLAEDSGLNVQQILNSIRKQVMVLSIPDFNRFQNSFTHIFAGGYAAGYYSYLWAEVLSCDAFEKFRTSGLLNHEVGQSFLTQILEQGGSKPAMDLFIDFAGREPEVDALLQHHGIQ